MDHCCVKDVPEHLNRAHVTTEREIWSLFIGLRFYPMMVKVFIKKGLKHPIKKRLKHCGTLAFLLLQKDFLFSYEPAFENYFALTSFLKIIGFYH